MKFFCRFYMTFPLLFVKLDKAAKITKKMYLLLLNAAENHDCTIQAASEKTHAPAQTAKVARWLRDLTYFTHLMTGSIPSVSFCIELVYQNLFKQKITKKNISPGSKGSTRYEAKRGYDQERYKRGT